MAAMVLQRGLQNSRIFDKSFVLEMNEATGDVINKFSFNKEILQAKAISDMSPREIQQRPPHQGSIASLESRSFVDQSEDQPLTDFHVCRYDECHKFRQTKVGKDTTENPSSPLKNASLVLVIVLLLLWIIVYTILSRLKLL